MNKKIAKTKDFNLENSEDGFINDSLNKSIFFSDNILKDNFNIEAKKKENLQTLKALDIKDGVQMMLGVQMIGIHNLLKNTLVKANALSKAEEVRYYTNAAIKLSNTFTQQANLLNKLQGKNGQTINIQDVNISDGGQAIVGNVNSHHHNQGEKK